MVVDAGKHGVVGCSLVGVAGEAVSNVPALPDTPPSGLTMLASRLRWPVWAADCRTAASTLRVNRLYSYSSENWSARREALPEPTWTGPVSPPEATPAPRGPAESATEETEEEEEVVARGAERAAAVGAAAALSHPCRWPAEREEGVAGTTSEGAPLSEERKTESAARAEREEGRQLSEPKEDPPAREAEAAETTSQRTPLSSPRLETGATAV